jgi:hypothetical protein
MMAVAGAVERSAEGENAVAEADPFEKFSPGGCRKH